MLFNHKIFNKKNYILFYLINFLLLINLYANNINNNSLDKYFEQYKNLFLEEYWRFNHDEAIYNGRYEFASKLEIPCEYNNYLKLDYINHTQELLDHYFKYNLNLLNSNNQSDFKLMYDHLNKTRFYLTQYKNHEWDPSIYNIADLIGLLLNTEYNTLESRLLDIKNRLSYIDQYYAAAKQNLKIPTKEHTELAINQLEGSYHLFNINLINKINESKLYEVDKYLLMQSAYNAMHTIENFVNWLKSKQIEWEQVGYKNFRLGKELYEQKFNYEINSSYTVDELFIKALEEKQVLHNKMSELAQKLWFKYYPSIEYPKNNLQAIKLVLDKLALDHVKPAEFVNTVKQQIPQLSEFVIQKDLLDIDLSKPLVVRETPEYIRGIAGASIQNPGPYDKEANTYYNVDPLDTYEPEKAESLLREYNNYMLRILNIHEAVPGHYTQLVHSNKSPSLIKAIFGNGSMIEGWAVYSERMMLEEGYGDHSPELWLTYYKWNLRSVINTILDYSVHVLDMDKDSAIKLLTMEGFQELQEAEGKWRRVTLTQVQLASYFNGYKEIYNLREELKEKMGDSFDLKSFHNKFLSYGSAPVKVIRDIMLDV